MLMARVHSTSRLTTEGETPDTIETSISEVMKELGIIEPKVGEEAGVAERSGSKVVASSDEKILAFFDPTSRAILNLVNPL